MSDEISRRGALLGASAVGLVAATVPGDAQAPREGHVLDLALATDAAAATAGPQTVAIRTAGFSRLGIGAALYVATGRGEDDLATLVTRDGRRFRLAEDELDALRPEALGALGDGEVVAGRDGDAVRFTGNDDSEAIAAAFRIALHRSGAVVLGPRRYRITQPLPPLTGPVAVRGAGSLKTWLLFDPAARGDAISIVETWMGKDPTEIGAAARTVAQPRGQTSGVSLSGFTLSGSRTAAGPQNGLMLYERNDNVHISDVEIRHIKGRGFCSGISRRPTPATLLRESRIDRLQIRRCGDGAAGLPAFELSSDGFRPGDDATNNISITDLLVIYSSGRGVVMDNRNAFQDQRYVSIVGAYVEGQDATAWTVRGSVTNLEVTGMEINGSRDPAVAALVFEASERDAIPRPPRACFFSGAFGPVASAIRIAQGKDLHFRITQNGASVRSLIVERGCTGAVLFDGGGGERGGKLAIDPVVAHYVTVDVGRRVWSLSDLPDPAALLNALIVVRDVGGGRAALARSDGRAWSYVALDAVPLQRGRLPG